MKEKLKLFVFEEFCPDYTDGLAFAIASTEAHARELIEKERGREVCDWGKMKVCSLSEPIAFSVAGGC